MRIPVSKIKVKKRIRKDSGDLHSLRESMRKIGLISPLVITESNELLAGYRRLLAAKELGWNEIECHVLKAKTRKEKFNIEVEENVVRKGFTPLEMAAIDEERRYIDASYFRKFVILISRFARSVLHWIRSVFGLRNAG